MLPGLKRLFHIAMGLLLLSGFYNFFTVIPKVSGLGEVKSIYHAVIGIKILLAVVLFGIVSATLASLAEAPEPPARLSRWLGPIVLLAAVILLLSAFLRRTWYLDPRLATPPAITAPVPIEPQ
jgi:putative copper export protein